MDRDRNPRREELHNILKAVLGSTNVYFQPPPNVAMQYPAIVYERDNAETRFAGNLPYFRMKRYKVTVIDSNPDSAIPDKVAALPLCVQQTHFAVDQLNHDVYQLYF